MDCFSQKEYVSIRGPSKGKIIKDGFWCEICEVGVGRKDQRQTHVNSAGHQKRVGELSEKKQLILRAETPVEQLKVFTEMMKILCKTLSDQGIFNKVDLELIADNVQSSLKGYFDLILPQVAKKFAGMIDLLEEPSCAQKRFNTEFFISSVTGSKREQLNFRKYSEFLKLSDSEKIAKAEEFLNDFAKCPKFSNKISEELDAAKNRTRNPRIERFAREFAEEDELQIFNYEREWRAEIRDLMADFGDEHPVLRRLMDKLNEIYAKYVRLAKPPNEFEKIAESYFLLSDIERAARKNHFTNRIKAEVLENHSRRETYAKKLSELEFAEDKADLNREINWLSGKILDESPAKKVLEDIENIVAKLSAARHESKELEYQAYLKAQNQIDREREIEYDKREAEKLAIRQKKEKKEKIVKAIENLKQKEEELKNLKEKTEKLKQESDIAELD